MKAEVAARRWMARFLVSLLLQMPAGPASGAENRDLRQQVFAAETAFAATMAARDHVAFRSFLDDEAVFFSGTTALRGSAQVAAAWKSYYESPQAPFSWTPEQVEVLDSGELALSTGIVLDAEGRAIGRFNSIWRRQAGGEWKVVFDRGSCLCPVAGAQQGAQ